MHTKQIKMQAMIKVVDIVYHCHHEYTSPKEVLDKHLPTLGFTKFIKDRVDYTVVRHLNYEGKETVNGIRYAFFKRRNAPWQIPYKTHRYINSLNPDIILVHGFIFPLQVIALKILLGKRCTVVLQHHADYPANSVRKLFQKIADKYVNAYMFTSAAIADPWLDHKIIENKNKIKELAGASVSVEKKDKFGCKKKLHLSGENNFLWVGRLNENKDPLTILKAFSHYVLANTTAKLLMIYHTEELLAKVKKTINENDQLRSSVRLVGKIDKTDMAEWYNAADFFILGSHAEAAGYALLEAMSVGCIPVVTSIPAFKKVIGNEGIGFLFPPGDEQALIKLLNSLHQINVHQQSAAVEDYFHKNLSFKNIADGMYDLFMQLNSIQL